MLFSNLQLYIYYYSFRLLHYLAIRHAYSQIAYGKLCARLFNYLILWVRFMVEVLGIVDPHRYPNPNNNANYNPTLTLIVTLTPKGSFKCYVTLFFGKLDPHPPPHNANNIEHYTFVTLFPENLPPPPPPSALRNT